MARASPKQERLSVWLRMKQKDTIKMASSPSTSGPGHYKSLVDNDEAEIVSAIQDAVKNKAKKFSGRCLHNSQMFQEVALASASSFFDRLPPELLEIILSFLNNSDIKAVCAAYSRCHEAAEGSPVLKLHFVPRCQLLTKCCQDKSIHNVVLNNSLLRDYFSTNITFVRLLPELRTGYQRSIANTVFHFGSSEIAAKLAYLFSIAAHRYARYQHHLFVVVAVHQQEGEQLARALKARGLEAAYFSSFNSNGAFAQLQSAPKKFFFVVSKLTPNFRQTGMQAIINFQKLQDLPTYLSLHTLDPRTVHTYVDIEDSDQLRQARDLIQYLEVCGKKPLSYSNPLILCRSHYL